VVGVMSGTSLDGVDLVECFFDVSEDGYSYKMGVSVTVPYTQFWKNRLQQAITFSEKELIVLNTDYTELLAELILAFLKDNKIEKLDAVCSHGHTILHQPEKGRTLQIGNLPKLALLLDQTVVCDFRVQDVAMGGQGAPLVPVGDQLLFKNYDYCLNLGGFANISTEISGNRIAYDICPVNIVLNIYAEMLGKPYDDGGEIALKGKVDKALLMQLNQLPFYSKKPPKSLGLEWVKEQILPILNASGKSPENVIATFTEHIAMQISKELVQDASVLITGGGAYNRFLLKRLGNFRNCNITVPPSEIIEFKEALIFALLGVLKLQNEVNCLASVTGAESDHSSGKIFRI